MGAFTSRRNAGVEEVDISTANAYRYPPKSGCYFGSHFIMGGERFETTQPEAYLFGENQDLNFFGNRPVPFPYPAPQAHEPTKTLKSLVNIRKDSLKFVKVLSDEGTKDGDESTKPEETTTSYNIEFTFDSDVKCAITIYYFATEEICNKNIIYHPRDPTMNSETFHYKRGANQVFNQSTHVIDPSQFHEEEWQYNPDKDTIPVVIHCVVEEEEYTGHSHMMFAIIEKSPDGGYAIKPLKQKQMVDGLCYLLQEIYGIENKNQDVIKDDDVEDSGSECVICLVEMRDTLILPCRHLCLCNCCADNLRYQASNCPICRSPFRALLQIRAMRKKPATLPLSQPPSSPESSDAENAVSQEGVPPGYQAISLIEALNGPRAQPAAPASTNTPLAGFPDARGGDTPEGSPKLGKKLKRQASTASTRSRGGSVTGPRVEEAREALEEDRGDLGDRPAADAEAAETRETTPPEPSAEGGDAGSDAIETGDDPAKSPRSAKKFKNLTAVRYPTSYPDKSTKEDVVQIVDETAAEAEHDTKLGDPLGVTPSCAVTDYNRSEGDGADADASADANAAPSSHVVPPGGEQTRLTSENESMLPTGGATCHADGSDSSYSSTGSANGLLAAVVPPGDNKNVDKVDV